MREFLLTHSRVRTGGERGPAAGGQQAIDFANKLTGEPIDLDNRMTELSGGQTRALLIADATVICSTPVVLLDEVENAGIHRTRAVQLLRQYRKIFIFVTHDPRIALLSDFRIVMQGGRVTQVLSTTSDEERGVSVHVNRLDDALSALREKLRHGTAAERRRTQRTCRRSHESRHLCRAGHDRQDLGAPSHDAQAAAGRQRVAFLKLDVQYADEDELLAKEFGIPTRKVYSGELCPDHCNVMVLGDALALGRSRTAATCCWSRRPASACAVRPTSTAAWAWSCSKPPAA